MKNRSIQLDFLRTLAILLVFTEHFNIFAGDDWFSSVGRYGWAGVDLFFILSGFLITHQLLKSLALNQTISLKEFYIRRGFRIWPNFFAVLLIYLTIPAFTERGVLPPLWRFFTFTQNFGLDFTATGTFSHAWSLCVEEQFYLILPFLLIFMYRRASFRASCLLFGILILGGIVLRYALWERYLSLLYDGHPLHGIGVPYFREIYYPTYCRLDGLVIGVSLASLQRLKPEIWEKLIKFANGFLFAGLGCLAIAGFTVYDKFSIPAVAIGFPLIDLGFGLVVIAALSPQGLFSKLKIPGVEWGATLAFAFYLTHKQIIHLTKGWLIDNGVSSVSPLYPLVIFFSCLVVSGLLYALIERPFLIFRDRLLHQRSLHFEVAS